jgi:hypothetical protein
MPWTLWQYDGIVDGIMDRVDESTRFALEHRLGSLIDQGNKCRDPISKSLGNGIFECRAKQVRLLFYFGESGQIVFVNGIIKKQWKVPQDAIKLAVKRRTAIIGKREVIHAYGKTGKYSIQ